MALSLTLSSTRQAEESIVFDLTDGPDAKDNLRTVRDPGNEDIELPDERGL
jgi:hypothetical protein